MSEHDRELYDFFKRFYYLIAGIDSTSKKKLAIYPVAGVMHLLQSRPWMSITTPIQSQVEVVSPSKRHRPRSRL
jgi:hypothetical protein